VDPHGFGFAVPATNSAYSKSSTKTSSHGNAADATNTIDPALMEHAWLQLAPFVRAQCDAQVCAYLLYEYYPCKRVDLVTSVLSVDDCVPAWVFR